MNFINENFCLSTTQAERLFFDFAKEKPIFDFHCHLSPKDIATNKSFQNLTEIWLAGDHYKWRAMRYMGVDENLITGNASDFDKYMAWAKVVPQTIGNPLYHWSHLELKRIFNIDKLLNEENAEEIWHDCNKILQSGNLSTQKIMKAMNVHSIGTTDDPIDNLLDHKAIKSDNAFNINVRPSWRPDKILKIWQKDFKDYVNQLEKVADIPISSFRSICDALAKRMDVFALNECNAADHSIENMNFVEIPNIQILDEIVYKKLNGNDLSELEMYQYNSALIVWLGRQYHDRKWVMQLHLNAQRDNNAKLLHLLGSDIGCDAIGDGLIAKDLAKFLSMLDYSNQLPKTVLFSLNPRDNPIIGALMGAYAEKGIPGKIQFGSGWWFNDTKDGMLKQMNELAHMGFISQFIGMLTDSRSFLSYTRHEYFRRILCNLFGEWMQKGEIPTDYNFIGKIINNICFDNAKNFFLTS